MTNKSPSIDLSVLARKSGARHVPFSQLDARSWCSAPELDQAIGQLDQCAMLRAVLLLYGPNGVGKSALASYWAGELDQRRFHPLKLTQATLSGSSLLAWVTSQLGKEPTCRRERNLARIQEALAELENRVPVILMDEAQLYSYAAMEEIRLLLGLDMQGQSAFALVLIADDYFLNTLKLRHHRALYSRIAFTVHLAPWKNDQCRRFLDHGFEVAGLSPAPLVPAATELMVSASGGLVRSLGLIARNAWIAALQCESKTIEADHAQKAINQVACVPGLQAMSQPPSSPQS